MKHLKLNLKKFFNNLQRIKIARNTNYFEVLLKFKITEIYNAPSLSKHLDLVRSFNFNKLIVKNNLAYSELPNGIKLYGFISKPNHKKSFYYVNDTIQPYINEDTFLLAIDIAQRFSNYNWSKSFKKDNKLIIECGAYLGHKTIKLCKELLCENGIIYAYEMMPKNFEILKKNIEINNLQKKIIPINCGVSNKDESIDVYGYGRQRNTIEQFEKLNNRLGIKIRTNSLAALINKIPLNHSVDLLYMTINGSEVKALETIKDCNKEINYLFIAALYKIGKISNLDLCLNILKKYNYRIISVKDKIIEAKKLEKRKTSISKKFIS
jgi:FkbM family methyltransferase